MIKANFSTYNNYVTDTLYQWDLNRNLVITGLNLSTAPEIHFANSSMDRAIVRKSTLEDGIVTVRIPNSLLQKALTVKAYVGLYENDMFKTIETIEIPVIPKERPLDYTIEDSDKEIYSFKKLEYDLENAKTEIEEKCDATLEELTERSNAALAELNASFESAKDELETEVENTTATLSAQVANIIAHNNDTKGNTELLDIRTGADGTVYGSAGEAVREQIKKGALKDLIVAGKNFIDENTLVVGALASTGIENNGTTSFKRTDYILLAPGSYVYSNANKSYSNFRACIYNLTKTFESTVAGSGNNQFTIDSPKYVRIHDSVSATELQLEMGTEPTEYEVYSEKIKDEYLKDVYNAIAETDGKVEGAVANARESAEKVENMLEMGKNLYNHNTITIDLYLNASATQGNESDTKSATTQNSFALSDWIDVVAGEYYVYSHSGGNIKMRTHFVDESGLLTADTQDIAKNTVFQIPEGTVKLRFSSTYAIMTESNLQIEKVDGAEGVSTEYEEYQKTLRKTLCPRNASKNNFLGKTILFDGDSITYGSGFTDLTLAYPYLVCKELGANIINKAIGGSTLASNPDNDTRNPVILRYDSQISDEIAKTVDIVYIAIGTNDWAYGYTPVGTMADRVTTTFYGALHLLCQGLLTKFPGKPIIFATPIKRRIHEADTPDYTTGSQKTLKDYCNIIKEVCDYYSIPVIDMYSESGLTPFVDGQRDLFFQETNGSGVHPNAEGAKIMARRVSAYLKSVIGM